MTKTNILAIREGCGTTAPAKSSVGGSDHFAGANKAWATYFHSFIDNILAKHAALHPQHNIAVIITNCKYNTVSLHSTAVKCSMDR